MKNKLIFNSYGVAATTTKSGKDARVMVSFSILYFASMVFSSYLLMRYSLSSFFEYFRSSTSFPSKL